jgi:ubiquinone/menaquinone biosynthesis C-methylase UbiE
MPTADEIRATQRETWNKFSSGWEKWDDVVASVSGPIGDAMIAALDIASDQRHLEIAGGTGEPGLSIAARASQGHVTISDLAPDMLAAAERRAAKLGIGNVAFREASADDLPFDDASFDSVGCRFGFMFFPDLAQACAELVRVLRPGGQATVAVWAGPEGNLWATLPMAAIASEIEMPPPDPNAPGMFRCAPPGMMAGLLTDAGLHDVVETEVGTGITTSGAEEYWQLVRELTAPVVAVLAQADDAGRERITAKVIEAARAHEADGSLTLAGAALVISGRK